MQQDNPIEADDLSIESADSREVMMDVSEINSCPVNDQDLNRKEKIQATGIRGSILSSPMTENISPEERVSLLKQLNKSLGTLPSSKETREDLRKIYDLKPFSPQTQTENIPPEDKLSKLKQFNQSLGTLPSSKETREDPPTKKRIAPKVVVDLVTTDDDDVVNNLVNMRPANIDQQNSAEVEELFDTDGRISWIEEFQYPSKEDSSLEHYIYGKKAHRWRDVEWTTFLVLKGSNIAYPDKIGLYFGIQNPSLVPDYFRMKVKFYYSLLDNDGDVISTGGTVDYIYKKEIQQGRIDRGLESTFTADNFSRAITWTDEFIYFKCRVFVEEMFLPAIPPPNYNSKLVTGMVGIENLGATCYLNSLLQMLFHINSFRKAVYEIPYEDEDFKSSTTLALQSVFKSLQQSSREVTTKDLTVAFGWTSQDAFMQQDVQEMMRILLDKLEEKMKGTAQDGLIRGLFAGSVRSYIRCVNVSFESTREEDFYDIQLDVKNCANVYESFRKYIAIEMLDGENQYDAGKDFGKQDAKKGVIFSKFPPVLTIHLKRFDFDMYTMGFIKIHDHYEFPLMLNVDEFLAKDCPPDSRSVPNDYILHSVLVHAGDVGGGHYYAYIRPSTESNYNFIYSKTLTACQVDSNKQWFKFNDETVLGVQEREAVDYCYGCRPDENHDFIKRTSSAYMLVYIRKHDAADIMRNVEKEDIPSGLIERLENELIVKRRLERQAQRERIFSCCLYATTEEFTAFSQYSKAQDFISEDTMKSITILTDCLYLGVHLKIAELLNMSPLRIRLWTIEGTPLRVFNDIDRDQFSKRLEKGDYKFFVQFIDSVSNEEDAKVFDNNYKKLVNEFNKWKQRLLQECQNYPELQLPGDEDLTRGCGLCMGKRLLNSIKDSNPPVFDQLLEDLNILDNRALALMVEFHEDFDEDSMLLFFKIFDPLSLIDHSKDGNRRSSHGNPCILSPQIEIEVENVEFVVKKKEEEDEGEYPLQFLGMVEIERTATTLNLRENFFRLLKQRWAFDEEDDVPEIGFFSCLSSIKFYKIVESSGLSLSELELSEGVLLATVGDSSNMRLDDAIDPYLLQSPLHWMKNRICRRVFAVFPLEARDLKVLLKWQLLRERQQSNDSSEASVVATVGGGGDQEMDDPSAYRLPDANPRKRSLESSESSKLLSRPLQVMQGFEADVPLNALVSDLILYIGHTLDIDSTRLLITVVPQYLDAYDLAFNCPFYSIADIDAKVEACIRDKKIANKPHVQHYVFYRISPFPLTSFAPGTVTDERQSRRFLEFIIADERIKTWRRRFLQGAMDPIDKVTSQYEFEEEHANEESSSKKRSKSLGTGDCWSSSRGRDKSGGGGGGDVGAFDVGADAISSSTKSLMKPASLSEFDILESRKVRIAVNKDDSIAQGVELLKAQLGLPSHFGALLPRNNKIHSEIEHIVSMADERSFRHEFLQKGVAVFSNYPEFNEEQGLSILIAICYAKDGVIVEIAPPGSSMQELPPSWMELQLPKDHQWCMTAQLVLPGDVSYMLNKNEEVHSMVLSVFNFTLLGNTAQPCDADFFSGPFVTYVREDDTYETLLDRLVLLTGETALRNLRLAIVDTSRNFVPLYLPRTISPVSTSADSSESLHSLNQATAQTAQAAQTADAGDSQKTHCDKDLPEKVLTLWERFSEIFPEYSKKDLHQVRISSRGLGRHAPSAGFPCLGIQRSAAEMQVEKLQSRGKRLQHTPQRASGIKIV